MWGRIHFREYIFFSYEYRVFEISTFCTLTGSFRLQNGLNLHCRLWLVVNVQKDACFGLSLSLCTIFNVCSQISETRNNSVSSRISGFECFPVWCTKLFTRTQWTDWIWLKNIFSRKQFVFTFYVFCPKNSSQSKNHLKCGQTKVHEHAIILLLNAVN